jgi:hypothetical protein
MTDLIVDGGAYAFREAFKMKLRRPPAQFDGFIINKGIDIFSRHSGSDVPGYMVQNRRIHFAAFSNELNLLWCFDNRAGRHGNAFGFEASQLSVEFGMAFFVFQAASAPAGLISFDGIHVFLRSLSI